MIAVIVNEISVLTVNRFSVARPSRVFCNTVKSMDYTINSVCGYINSVKFCLVDFVIHFAVSR